MFLNHQPDSIHGVYKPTFTLLGHPIPGTLPPTPSADRQHALRGSAARCDAAALRGADDGGGDGKRILGRGADGNEGDAAWPKRISGGDFHGILGIQFVNG